jgi:putative inorganic carbon (hco3(-)) transporter
MRKLAQSIVSWEWLILIILLPIFWFPNGWGAFVLLLVPLFWLLRKLVTGRFFPATPDDVANLAILTAVLVSFTAVFDITLSFPKIAGLILGIAFFYAVVQHARNVPHGRYYIVGVILFAGSGLAVAGLLASMKDPILNSLYPALAISPFKWTDLPLMGGLSVNPNELAGLLCWIVPLLIVCTIGLWQARSCWRSPWFAVLQIFLLAMLLVDIFVLLATRSRGGILSVLTALLVILAIRFLWGRWLLFFFLIGMCSFLFIGSSINLILPAEVLAFDEFGLEGRLEIWSRALYGLAEFPFTGMSMNGFRELVQTFYPIISRSPEADIGHAHNHLLQAGLDLGIPGLIAYLSLWIISVGLLWSVWHKSPDNSDRVLILGISGSLAAGWIFGLLDTIALGAKPGFLCWLLIALLVSVWERVPEDKKPILY